MCAHRLALLLANIVAAALLPGAFVPGALLRK